MKKIILPLLFVIVSFANADDFKLEKLWETGQVLKTPESVIYNPADSILYISNINGSPTAKDSNGFISKVTLNGKIKELEWVSGLNAPKGSGICKDKLFVTDIDLLVEIDIPSAKILNRYPIPGAKFLNDVAIDTSGTIYISDSSPDNSLIYKFKNGKIAMRVKGKDVQSPNGLWIEDKELVFGNSGDGFIKALNLSNMNIRTIAHIGSGIDGLRADGKGNWLVSDWSGKTSSVDTNGKIKVLLDTTEQKINSADIEYIQSMNMLIIPTFFDNRVVGYRLLPDRNGK